MELDRKTWITEDIPIFEQYLRSLALPQKEAWTRNIVRSLKPVLAINSPTLRNIIKKITKGNYLQFLDLRIFSTHESTLIYGGIISALKDFTIFKDYLEIYLNNIDSWAHTDTLSLNNFARQLDELLSLSKQLLNSPHTYQRRMSLIILLKLLNFLQDYTLVFEALDSLSSETEYYVNMAGAWLLCDCFIKSKDQTLKYYQNNTTNSAVINKSIQKCRDSFRISKEDKDFLLRFKR